MFKNCIGFFLVTSTLFSDNCTCYTPAFYDLQCDLESLFNIECLYWYAKQANLFYALVVEEQDNILAPKNFKSLKTSWDPGVRIGIGGNYKQDGFDLFVSWTHYQSCTSDRTSKNAQLINPWNSRSPLLFNTISAKWKFIYNSLDLELGRKYWVSPCMTLRPFAGLRSSWFDETFQTKSKNEILLLKNRITSEFWGNGLLIGVDPAWALTSCFILFGHLETSLIWGRFKSKDRTDSCPESRSRFFQMLPILEAALGLRWEKTWDCYRYRTALDIGWEQQIWFDYNHCIKTGGLFTTSNILGFRTYVETSGTLNLGGVVVRVKVDF